MQALNLKVLHRLLLRGAVDNYGREGHSLSTLNKLLKILDKIVFTDEEVKELNIQTKDNSITWRQNKNNKPDGKLIDVEKPFELSDEEGRIVGDILKKMHDKKEFKFENIALQDVAKQLGEDVIKHLEL